MTPQHLKMQRAGEENASPPCNKYLTKWSIWGIRRRVLSYTLYKIDGYVPL